MVDEYLIAEVENRAGGSDIHTLRSVITAYRNADGCDRTLHLKQAAEWTLAAYIGIKRHKAGMLGRGKINELSQTFLEMAKNRMEN